MPKIFFKIDSVHIPAIIYRVEAVGLSLSNYIFKILLFVGVCETWGNSS